MPRNPTLTWSVVACLSLGGGCGDDAATQQNPTTAGTAAQAAGMSGGTPAPVGGAGSAAVSGGAAGRSPSAGAGASAGASAAGSGGSRPTEPVPVAGQGGSGSEAGATAEAGSGGVAGEGGAFEMCVASLKSKCSYEDKETACSSLTTPSIPLSAGGAYGDLEMKAGPYGGFVEWNEGMAFANPINANEEACPIIAGTFGEPQSVTDDVLDLRGADLSLYTVFRPACMKDGEKYPVITWGNGTCGQTGGYATFLATLASHGFVVFASNSRFTDAGNNEMLRALDFAKAANEDSTSVYYQRLDLDQVGAMGHSQGASATVNAARDPRIKAVILWNGPVTATKPFLAVSGDRDIGGYTPASMATAVMGAAQPGAWLYYHKVLETGGSVTGHLTLMEQPDRVVDPTIAWWKYMLKGDEEAKKMFTGADCGLCKTPEEYEFGQNNLP